MLCSFRCTAQWICIYIFFLFQILFPYYKHWVEFPVLYCRSLLVIYFIYSSVANPPHSSALAWKIPWTEEPGGLQSMGSRRVGHDWATSLSLFTFLHWRRKWQPTPLFLPGESQGRGSLSQRENPRDGRLSSMGLHRVGHDWSDLEAAAANPQVLKTTYFVNKNFWLFITSLDSWGSGIQNSHSGDSLALLHDVWGFG